MPTFDVFRAPIDDRFLEDYLPGTRYEFGEIEVTEAEIIEFATRFDPQPFHVDPAAAKAGPFGGLIASGWHTSAVMMRLFADNYLSRNASLGGPGVDELRWPAPVRPGDVLRLRVGVKDARRSNSKPDRGVVRSSTELLDHGDRTVFTATVVNFIRTRGPA